MLELPAAPKERLRMSEDDSDERVKGEATESEGGAGVVPSSRSMGNSDEDGRSVSSSRNRKRQRGLSTSSAGVDEGKRMMRFDSIDSAFSAGSEVQSDRERTVDAYYEGQFGFGKYPLVFNPTVLGCVTRINPIRKVCIMLVKSDWFEAFILLAILANSILIAFWDPVADQLGFYSHQNEIISGFEWFFLPLFTVEAMVKIIAQGVTSRPSGYFREAWNWLDFFIVVLGWIPLIVEASSGQSDSSAGSLTVLRAVRVLRPLRALQFFPALKDLVRAILNAATSIGAVLILSVSILVIFALVGVTLFQGKLRQHCGIGMDPLTSTWAIPAEELDSYCSLDPGSFGRSCPRNLTCIVTDFNPSEGLQSFDNIGLALLTVFQVVTEEGWSSVMYALFDTTYRFTGIYFILLVLFGSYFMVNLIISALSVNYMLVRQDNQKREELERERTSFMEQLVQDAEFRAQRMKKFLALPLEKQIASMEMRLMYSYEMNRGNPHYSIVTDEMYAKYREKNIAAYPKYKRKLRRRLAKHSSIRNNRMSTRPHRVENLIDDVRMQAALKSSVINAEDAVRVALNINKAPSLSNYEDTFGSMRHIYSRFHAGSLDSLHTSEYDSTGAVSRGPSDSDGFFDVEMGPITGSENSGRAYRDPAESGDYFDAMNQTERPATPPHPGPEAFFEVENDGTIGSNHSRKNSRDIREIYASRERHHSGSHRQSQELERIRTKLLPYGLREDAPWWSSYTYERIVSRTWFKITVLVLILLNTAILATEFLGQPRWLTELQEKSNIVFLTFFTLEIVLRLMGEGIRYYFQRWFNRFDFLIVASGYIELFFEGNVASIFRLLRILRFIKLATYWETFHDLLVAVDATVKKLLPFLVFFGIFLYIFTISGLHFLGGRLVIPQFVEESSFIFPEGTPVPTNVTETIPNVDFDCTTNAGDYYLGLDNGTFVWHCPVRTNYDTFLWSFVTSFQVVTGEDWNSVMYTAVEKTGQYWFVFYYLFLVIFGSFIVLNFFIAILIDTFVEQHVLKAERKRIEKEMRKLQRRGTPMHLFNGDATDADCKATPNSANGNRSTAGISIDVESFENARGRNNPDESSASSGETQEIASETDQMSPGPPIGTDAVEAAVSPRRVNGDIERRREQFKHRRASSKPSSLKDVLERKNQKVYDLGEDEIKELEAFNFNSLFCLQPTNMFRIEAAKLVLKKWFDVFILIVILLSCIVLATSDPQEDDGPVLYGINLAITVIFAFEAGLKIFAFGFVMHKGAYLRDSWNILDFVVLIVSVVDVSMPNSNTAALQVFRALRALRPLRAIRKFEGLRVVFRSFTMAVIPCLQVLALCIVFYAVFAIIGQTLFLGRFHACYECSQDGTEVETCLRNYTEGSRNCFVYEQYAGATGEDCPPEFRCEGSGIDSYGNPVSFRWLNPTYGSLTEFEEVSDPFSFDNFFQAFLLLFEISSMEIWLEPMQMATDVVEIGREPVRGSSDGMAIFFVVFIFMLQFFMLQVFVAVLIDTYFDSADSEKGDAFMTPEQRKWVDYNKKALMRPFTPHARLKRPRGACRRSCFDIVESFAFKVFIYLIIIANTILIMSQHFPSSREFDIMQTSLDALFGSIYLVEAVLKIIGLGPRNYFGTRSNVFDFCILLAVIVGWVMSGIAASRGDSNSDGEAIFSAIEALRVLRVFRLFQLIPPLKPLLSTLIQTIYPLLNILGLIMLFIFTYAILGMQLFGHIIAGEFPGEEMTFVDEHVNFNNFPNAFFALFVMSTGESWNAIMRDLAFASPHAIWFCISFVIIMQLFLLNLFVAVVLASFTNQFEDSRRPRGFKEHVDEKAVRDFNKEWNTVHLTYVDEIRALINAENKLQPACRRPDRILKAERALKRALANPEELPATRFPELMLRLKAPLGFRKRSKTADFSTSHVMRYVRDRHVPVSETGMIQFYQTLRALIDINVLQGHVPRDVENFLYIKLSQLREPATPDDANDAEDSGETLTSDSGSNRSLDRIIAKEQIKTLILNYATLWRIRMLKKHGASDERIRQVLEKIERQQKQIASIPEVAGVSYDII